MKNYRRLFLLMKVMVLSLLIFPVRSSAATPDKEVAKSREDRSLISISEPLQQQKRVTGIVTEKDGTPLAGVTVVVTGTTQGTITGQNGEYGIDIPGGAGSLTFSFIGMETQVINIGSSLQINVIMSQSAVGLEEVVVIGYGTESKRNISGAISSVRSDDIKEQAVISFDQSLAGKLAGVDVSQSMGAPGGGVTISIRGVSSITSGNAPLYVIDGVPITPALDRFSQGNDPRNATYITNPLNSINVNDIQSIEVLKDAASTAIYGSRGSNGVIIIQTKMGSLNRKPEINFHSYFGISKLAKKVDVMDAYEFANYMKLARDLSWVSKDPVNHMATDPYSIRGFDDVVPSYMFPYLNGETGLTNTDWQDALYRTAYSKNTGLSISGGNEKTAYYLSLDYLDQEGIIRNSGLERISTKINIETNLGNKIRVGMSLSPSLLNNNLVSSEKNWGNEAVVIAALMEHPNFEVYNPDGSLKLDEGFNIMWSGESNIVQVQNPVALAEMIKNTLTEYRLLGNTFFEIDLLKDFTFKSMVGIDYDQMQREYYRPKNLSYRTEPAPTSYQNLAFERRSIVFNVIWENTLNYSKEFGKHSVKAILGYSAQQEEGGYTHAEGRDFTSDEAITIGNAQTRLGSSDKRLWSMLSYFARANYNYLGKYIVSASIRADGSSRFGMDSKWGYFPSVSLAWRVSDENFFENIACINDLKVRASYGLTGNNDIPYYGSQALLANSKYVIGGAVLPGLYPSTSPNSNLTWEKTRTLNVGFDLSMFQDKISVNADYYLSNTVDLLLNVPVPASSGYTSSLQNIGSVRNSGIELNLSFNQEWGAFIWNSSLNFSSNKNEVMKLGPDQTQIISNGGLTASHITRIGNPIGSFFGYKIIGKFENEEQLATIPVLADGTQAVGDFIYQDTNNDKVVNDDDRVILGNNYPDFVIGFTNNFSYKNFSLSFSLITKQGMEVINTMHRYLAEAWGNNLAVYLSDEAPRPVWGVGTKSHTRSSSWQVEDASFVRIRNITLGYNLPNTLLDRVKLDDVRVYVSAMNPFTWTKYSGYNPEVSSNYGNALTPGEEFGNYPSEKSLMIGINVNF